MDSLNQLDHSIFLILNGLHHDLLDAPMRFITARFTWIPFYALLLGWLVWLFRKKSLLLIITIALTITAADQLSSSLLKPLIKRPRPCHETSLQGQVNLVVEGCGGKYGFVSSHAADSFALATLLSLLLRPLRRGRLVLVSLFSWAMLVSYSRIYVGVHYPGDIVAGALLGIAVGWIFYALSQRFALKLALTNRK